MPPPSSTQLKRLLSQFSEATGASERTATRYLKSAGYKLNEAVDSFYSSGGGDANRPSPLQGKLESLFDSLRDKSNDGKDSMELDSTMDYLSNQLGVSLENAELFVALELVQAPTVGEITRKGFVEGWKSTAVDASINEQASYLKTRVKSLSQDEALFKKVYRHAFVAGKERDQKALSLENAVIYWGMLFSKPGLRWTSKNQNWLDLWMSFLDDNWTRSVSKDMWNMTLEFAVKSMDDESLSFWNEDGAWPGVIDDFVAWCRGRGIGKTEDMEVDE